jgi:hypothetical protein
MTRQFSSAIRITSSRIAGCPPVRRIESSGHGVAPAVRRSAGRPSPATMGWMTDCYGSQVSSPTLQMALWPRGTRQTTGPPVRSGRQQGCCPAGRAAGDAVRPRGAAEKTAACKRSGLRRDRHLSVLPCRRRDPSIYMRNLSRKVATVTREISLRLSSWLSVPPPNDESTAQQRRGIVGRSGGGGARCCKRPCRTGKQPIDL